VARLLVDIVCVCRLLGGRPDLGVVFVCALEIWRQVLLAWEEVRLGEVDVAVEGRTKYGRRLAAKNLDVSMSGGPVCVCVCVCH
jgi:hypothetical protein